MVLFFRCNFLEIIKPTVITEQKHNKFQFDRRDSPKTLDIDDIEWQVQSWDFTSRSTAMIILGQVLSIATWVGSRTTQRYLQTTWSLRTCMVGYKAYGCYSCKKKQDMTKTATVLCACWVLTQERSQLPCSNL